MRVGRLRGTAGRGAHLRPPGQLAFPPPQAQIGTQQERKTSAGTAETEGRRGALGGAGFA